MSILYNKICGIEIFCHLRQLKIPDGVCLSRPQPRRSAFLSHSHFPSDAIPRVPSHPPPIVHPLPGDGATAVRENDSFTFHASSCSETSLAQLHMQGESSGHQTVELLTSVAQRQDAARVDDHKSQKLSQPHDHPPPPVVERLQAGTQEYAECHDIDASGTLPGVRGQERKTVDLTNHSVQMEIIQMRDELKRFHDLKLHHKQLEAQLTARMRQGASETAEVND